MSSDRRAGCRAESRVGSDLAPGIDARDRRGDCVRTALDRPWPPASILDDLGLVASINQVVAEATGRQGLAGEFQVSGTERRLPPDVELAVFRIAQEAVTNAERHAAAGKLAVSLDFDDAGLRLHVEDDGVGFVRDPARDAGDTGDGHSLGLPGMQERARLVGGRLIVRSLPGQGTSVEALVPVPPPR